MVSFGIQTLCQHKQSVEDKNDVIARLVIYHTVALQVLKSTMNHFGQRVCYDVCIGGK